MSDSAKRRLPELSPELSQRASPDALSIVNIANLMAYTFAKKTSKHPEEFGHGTIHGIVAPEAANNASV